MKKWVTFAILEAENLPVGDSNGFSDPYVTVDYSRSGQRLLKTSVKQKTLNPKWEEEFPVQIELDEAAEFNFSVKDKDFIGCDRLCYLSVPVRQLLKTGTLQDWFPLTKKLNHIADVGYGRIHVKIKIEDYTPPPIEAPASRTSSMPIAASTATGDHEKRFLYEQDKARNQSMSERLDENSIG